MEEEDDDDDDDDARDYAMMSTSCCGKLRVVQMRGWEGRVDERLVIW